MYVTCRLRREVIGTMGMLVEAGLATWEDGQTSENGAHELEEGLMPSTAPLMPSFSWRQNALLESCAGGLTIFELSPELDLVEFRLVGGLLRCVQTTHRLSVTAFFRGVVKYLRSLM